MAEDVKSFGDLKSTLIKAKVPEKAFAEQWELKELNEDVTRIFGLTLPVALR